MSGYQINALKQVNNGLAPDDGSGDSLRTGAEVINNNFNVTRTVVNSQAAVDVVVRVGNGVQVNSGSGAEILGGSQTLNANSTAFAAALNYLGVSLSAGSQISFLTKAAMDADTAHAEGTIALVTNDPTAANNQSWRLTSGTWEITVDRLAQVLGNGAGFQQAGSGAVVRTVQDKSREIISGMDFGVVADGIQDDTASLSNALTYLGSIGGGVLNLGAGTHVISMAHSSNPHACIIIPPNVTIQGAGRTRTIITRPDSEREVDGVLMVNQGWDTEGAYDAAGNIVLRDFTITDGDGDGQRTIGDLIGFGHGDGLIIERVHAGNHDQHFVDIAGSRNVTLRDCSSDSATVGTYIDSATVQIDWAMHLGISGLLLDGTQTTDVLIDNCSFRNKNSTMVIQLGHQGSTAERIRIVGGSLDGAYKAGWSVIAMDSDCSLKDCEISSSEIIVNHDAARAINIVMTSVAALNHALHIHHNKIRGTGKTGIYAGITPTYSGASWPDFVGLNIHDNDIELTADTSIAGGSIYAIYASGFAGAINANDIRLISSDRTYATYGIWADRNSSLTVEGNKVKLRVASPSSGTQQVNSIYIYGSIPEIGQSTIRIVNNILDLGAQIVTNAINYVNNASIPWSASDSVIISGNTFLGVPISSHIYEAFPASDGSNGLTNIDFGGGVYKKSIVQGAYYKGLPLGLKKSSATAGVISAARINLLYSPTENGMATDAESIQFGYLGANDCAGTQICDVNQNAGTFSILTGKSGVSVVINNASFAPVIRSSGYVSGSVSI